MAHAFAQISVTSGLPSRAAIKQKLSNVCSSTPYEKAVASFVSGQAYKLKILKGKRTLGKSIPVDATRLRQGPAQSANSLSRANHVVELASATEASLTSSNYGDVDRSSAEAGFTGRESHGRSQLGLPEASDSFSGRVESNARQIEDEVSYEAGGSEAWTRPDKIEGNSGSSTDDRLQQGAPGAVPDGNPRRLDSGSVDFARLARMLTEIERSPSASRLAELSSIVSSIAETQGVNLPRSLATSLKTEPKTQTAAVPRRIPPSPNLPIRKDILQKPATSPSSPAEHAGGSVGPTQQVDAARKALNPGTGAVPTYVERSEYVAMRQRLNAKLSEANSYNRYLKREVMQRAEALDKYKIELSAVHSEIKELAMISKELAMTPAKASTAKIQGKFALSHLASKIEELQAELKSQVAGVEAMQLRDIPVEWYGMAEDVKVMGSFDSWTQGEQMSPESTGTYTRFTGTLRLQPGKYEIKFLVDGEWRLAPEWPLVGEGLMANNLLVVD